MEKRWLQKGLKDVVWDIKQCERAAHRSILTFTKAPLFICLVVIGCSTPQPAVFPPVRCALIIFLIQEKEREVAGLPMCCAFNGGQNWKDQKKMETWTAPVVFMDLALPISTTRIQRIGNIKRPAPILLRDDLKRSRLSVSSWLPSSTSSLGFLKVLRSNDLSMLSTVQLLPN